MSGRHRRAALGLTATLAAMGLSSTAWAFYAAATATSSNGSVSVANTAVQAVTIEAVVTGDLTGVALVPGGSADIVLKVSNPNSFPMVAVVHATAPVALVSGNIGTCTTHGVTAVVPDTARTVAAGSSTIRIIGGASMSTAGQTGCQGATFRVPVTVTSRTSGVA